ncbi:hypothetical protein VPH35_117409 [Triticum aestivum]
MDNLHVLKLPCVGVFVDPHVDNLYANEYLQQPLPSSCNFAAYTDVDRGEESTNQMEKDEIIDDKSDIFYKIIRLKEPQDELVQERDQLNKEIKLLRVERN